MPQVTQGKAGRLAWTLEPAHVSIWISRPG
jgi:hypothetical protein